MDYIQFQKNLGNQLVFTLQDIRLYESTFRPQTLYGWIRLGYVTRLTRGFYVHNSEHKRRNEFHLYSIANRIYEPSYISLESALSYYHLIPDVVMSITSISARKTTEFTTSIARFSYKSVKPVMMNGYTTTQFEGTSFTMATKEKAIIDYLYLHPELKTPGDMHEIRINIDELFSDFKEDNYWMYARIAESETLEKRAKVFLEYWRNPTYVQY